MDETETSNTTKSKLEVHIVYSFVRTPTSSSSSSKTTTTTESGPDGDRGSRRDPGVGHVYTTGTTVS